MLHKPLRIQASVFQKFINGWEKNRKWGKYIQNWRKKALFQS